MKKNIKLEIKGLIDKIYKINSNSVLCDVSSFDKLKEGGTVKIEENAARQLLGMGVVTAVKSKRRK